ARSRQRRTPRATSSEQGRSEPAEEEARAEAVYRLAVQVEGSQSGKTSGFAPAGIPACCGSAPGADRANALTSPGTDSPAVRPPAEPVTSVPGPPRSRGPPPQPEPTRQPAPAASAAAEPPSSAYRGKSSRLPGSD